MSCAPARTHLSGDEFTGNTMVQVRAPPGGGGGTAAAAAGRRRPRRQNLRGVAGTACAAGLRPLCNQPAAPRAPRPARAQHDPRRARRCPARQPAQVDGGAAVDKLLAPLQRRSRVLMPGARRRGAARRSGRRRTGELAGARVSRGPARDNGAHRPAPGQARAAGRRGRRPTWATTWSSRCGWACARVYVRWACNCWAFLAWRAASPHLCLGGFRTCLRRDLHDGARLARRRQVHEWVPQLRGRLLVGRLRRSATRAGRRGAAPAGRFQAHGLSAARHRADQGAGVWGGGRGVGGVGWGQGSSKPHSAQPCQHPTRNAPPPAVPRRLARRLTRPSSPASCARERSGGARAQRGRLRPRLAALGLARRWDVGEAVVSVPRRRGRAPRPAAPLCRVAPRLCVSGGSCGTGRPPGDFFKCGASPPASAVGSGRSPSPPSRCEVVDRSRRRLRVSPQRVRRIEAILPSLPQPAHPPMRSGQ